MTNDDLLIPMIQKINALERRLDEMESRDRAIGNMLKAIYDSNNNGIVDAAESVPWSGTSEGRPSTFPPSAHSHAGLAEAFSPKAVLTDSPLSSGNTDYYLPTYDLSGYSAVFVLLVGRWSTTGNFAQVRRYGSEDWYGVITGLSTSSNNSIHVLVPVVSNRIRVYCSAAMAVSYVHITGGVKAS